MLSGTASRCHSPFQQRGAPGHFEPPEALRSLRTRRRLGGQRRTSLLGPPCPRRYKTSPSEAPTARAAPCPAPLRSAPPRAAPPRRGQPAAAARAPRPLPIAQVQLSLMALCLLPDASFCSFRRISSILPPPGSSRSRGGREAGGEEEEEEEEQEEEAVRAAERCRGCPRRGRTYAGTVRGAPLPLRRR